MAAKSKKRKGSLHEIGKRPPSHGAKNKSQLAPEIQAAIDYGIDISALEANLRLSIAERLRQHQIALNTVKKLQKAKLL